MNLQLTNVVSRKLARRKSLRMNVQAVKVRSLKSLCEKVPICMIVGFHEYSLLKGGLDYHYTYAKTLK